MNLQKKTLQQFNSLSLSFGDKVILDNVSGSILEHSKIGLVGINGCGKTTFLKVLAGDIFLSDGGISANQGVEYVLQIDPKIYQVDKSLRVYLKSIIPEWWKALEIYAAVFGKPLKEDLIVQNLSGGELVKLHIAVALAKSPQILLLDEPTNHLDLASMQKLQKYLNTTNISFIVVSHNVYFLNNVVEEIWELNEGKITTFGGDYDFYSQKKLEEIEAKKRLYEVKKKENHKLQISARKNSDRSLRNIKRGAARHNPGEDKFFKGFFGNRSQKKAGKNKLAFDKKQEKINTELQMLKTKQRKSIYLDWNVNHKKGLVLSIKDGVLALPSNEVLINDINLSIYHGNRIAILGDNGSGKTTLSKQLEYNNSLLLSGNIRYGSRYKTLFIDQKYSLVLPNLSLVDNIQQHNPSINYENSRRLLSNLGFADKYVVTRGAHTLSGGETSRLAFAIATGIEIDVLVLDEPTNNLDVETVDVIVRALASYDATLIVISHNLNFLDRIGINKYYSIREKKLY